MNSMHTYTQRHTTTLEFYAHRCACIQKYIHSFSFGVIMYRQWANNDYEWNVYELKTNGRGIVCTINMVMGGYGYNDCGFKQQTDTLHIYT